jgi:dTDP-4-dehydrorhamnose 3,5-epimerase
MWGEYSTLELKKYYDHRGYFYESFSEETNKKFDFSFVQDNISFSKKGIIRGLHYQWDKPMGKLIHVVSGSIIDHIVDIRQKSKNYGKSYKFELTSDNNLLLWIPPGFAHGFEALKDSIIMYKCTSFYNKCGEGCINFFDKNLDLNFIIDKKNAIISEKDKKGISWEEYDRDIKFNI